jgi:pimeloyl-ACP methyl ester carboxylesterase
LPFFFAYKTRSAKVGTQSIEGPSVTFNAKTMLGLVLLCSACTTGSCNPKKNEDAALKPKPEEQVTPTTDSTKLISHYITAKDGVKIHYQTVGSGTPVLLLHGYYATGKDNFYDNGIVPALIKTNKVILIDHRGHGKSDKPHDAASYGENLWQDALMVLDDQKVKKAHVHGYSMGGSVTTQLLYNHPERFITAAFGGSGIGEYDANEEKKIPTDDQGPDPKEVEAKSVLMSAIKHDLVAMKACGSNAPWSGPEHAKIDLTKVTIPVLAINGQYDSPNAKTYRMKRELKNFRSVVLKGKSHLSAVTPGFIPDEYITELVSFITSNNP